MYNIFNASHDTGYLGTAPSLDVAKECFRITYNRSGEIDFIVEGAVISVMLYGHNNRNMKEAMCVGYIRPVHLYIVPDHL